MRCFIILFILHVNCNYFVFAQDKGGRWQFENNGYDTADWDQFDDIGELQGKAYYSGIAPVPEGSSYLYLDSLAKFDFFKVPDSEDLDFDNENIGISFWLNPAVLENVHFLVNKGIQDSNPKTTNYAVRISNTNKLEFLIRDSNNKAQLASSDISMTTGGWMFIAVYYDYSMKKVYFWNQLTAVPADIVDFDQDYFSNDDPLSIGSWSLNDTLNPSVRDFEGSMDDVRISGRLEDILPGVTSFRSGKLSSDNSNQASVTIYPNPASISSANGHIKFQIYSSHIHQVRYTIYNILGQRIFQGKSETVAGARTIQWKLHDNFGQQVGPGIYFVELKGLKDRLVNKFLILK